MNAKQIISELNAKGAQFIIHTNIMYGKGINGVGFESYSQDEKLGDGNLKTNVYRAFELRDDCLLVIENYYPPKIPWNKSAEQKPYSRRRYIGYDKITYITEIVED